MTRPRSARWRSAWHPTAALTSWRRGSEPLTRCWSAGSGTAPAASKTRHIRRRMRISWHDFRSNYDFFLRWLQSMWRHLANKGEHHRKTRHQAVSRADGRMCYIRVFFCDLKGLGTSQTSKYVLDRCLTKIACTVCLRCYLAIGQTFSARPSYVLSTAALCFGFETHLMNIDTYIWRWCCMADWQIARELTY